MAQLLSGLKADDSDVFNEAFGHKHKSSSDEDEDAFNPGVRLTSLKVRDDTF